MITTGGEGKVPPRKRLRGKIGNPSNAPELKSHNLVNQAGDIDNTFYNRFKVVGVFDNLPTSSVLGEFQTGLWYPIKCFWPPTGTSAHQRIGKKIRVKLLRLKGYVAYAPFLITQVRYRIVLYRTKKQQSYTHHDFLVSLYSGFDDLTEGYTPAGLQNHNVFNYYSSFFNQDYLKQNEVKRRVLFKGMIKPQPDVPNFSIAANQASGLFANSAAATEIYSISQGKVCGTIVLAGSSGSGGYFNTSSLDTAVVNEAINTTTGIQNIPFAINMPATELIGSFQPHVLGGQSSTAISNSNQRGFFPIDITVSMNDNVDCEKYDYVFVVESDWVIGQDPLGNFGTDRSSTNFFFSFVPHIYYTDD